MNKTYLFAIASILAVASLMAGTFTVIPSFAQISSTPSGDTNATMNMGVSSNATGGNATSGGTDNSTAPI